jgi:hypothetical protein
VRAGYGPPGLGGIGGAGETLVPTQGLRANLGRFSFLVLQVGFVGAMVGVERTVLPLLARSEFGLTSKTAALSFILAFGLAKAPGNMLAGTLADRFGRQRGCWRDGRRACRRRSWSPSPPHGRG